MRHTQTLYTTIIKIVIILLILNIYNASASELTREKIILEKSIDSCYKNMTILDINQIDRMMQMSLRVHEFTELENLLKTKERYPEQLHVIMNQHLVNDNIDSAYFYFKKVESLYLKDKNKYSLLIRRLNIQFVVWCVYNNYTSLGTTILNNFMNYNNKEGLKLNYWFYMILLASYETQYRLEEVIKVGKIILNLTEEHEHSLSFKLGAAVAIASCYLILEKPKEALEYSDLAENFLKEVPDTLFEDTKTSFKSYKMNNLICKAAALSYLKEFDKAEIALKEQSKLISSVEDNYASGPFDELQFALACRNWGYMIYHYNKKNYREAYKFLLQNEELNLPKKLSPDCYNTLKWEAILNEKLGNYKEANKSLKKQISDKDSLYNKNMTKEMTSTWAMFEVEKSQQEKLEIEAKTSMLFVICISTSILSLILIVLISYFVITKKKLKEKNTLLYSQQKKYQTTIELRNENINNQNSTYDLYLRISNYLKNTNEFTNTEISRDSLARALGTNRQYIINAISENTNMTFNEYINNLRLDYARNILANKNILIKTAYSEAGFNNRSTFSQQFKDKFGLSPSEFRNCAQKELETN